jgi:hypothetical protein
LEALRFAFDLLSKDKPGSDCMKKALDLLWFRATDTRYHLHIAKVRPHHADDATYTD